MTNGSSDGSIGLNALCEHVVSLAASKVSRAELFGYLFHPVGALGFHRFIRNTLGDRCKWTEISSNMLMS